MVSEAVGLRKPDPRIFQLALERLNSRPEKSLFVGDNPEADIAGARRAGLRTVWMRNSHWSPAGPADAVCEQLSDLPRLIEGLR